MILINKNNEPKEWTNYRMTPGVDYQAIPELVDSLLKEQGYICAYCMRRIPIKDRLYNKSGTDYRMTDEDHRVEHMKSRENHDDLKLDYSNMVICCPGHIGDEDHCDRLKGSKDISFSPHDPAFIDTLSYTSEGKIVSSNAKYQREIEGLLNLNTKLLVRGRKAVRDEVIRNLNHICKNNGNWNKATISDYLRKYESMYAVERQKEDGQTERRLEHYQYCGIISWYLRKKLKQLP